jgi:site-specific recombinase XerD
VGQVVRLPGGTVTLQDAVEAFLDQHDLARSTRRVYQASLANLVAGLGPATALSDLSGPRLAGWFRARHAGAAPATWNRELATLRAAVGWWRRRGWLAGDPTEGLERRRDRPDLLTVIASRTVVTSSATFMGPPASSRLGARAS